MKGLKFPLPKPDLAAYNGILQMGLDKYPQRKDNFNRHKICSRNIHANYMPIKMDIEPVSRCNLNCDMCQVAAFKNRKRSEDLSLSDFKEILESQPGVCEIKLQGLGEPFLHKDFVKMVEFASSKLIWVRTTTNATLLDKKNNYKRIIDAGVGEIQISIDGTSKETYEGIRKNAKFEKVMANCRLINNYCASLNIDKTRMWVLLQANNFGELGSFPAFAREQGFKRLTLSMDVNGWGNNEWTHKNKRKNVSRRMTQEIIDSLLDEANAIGIDLSFWDISTKYTRENPCPWPFERVYISSDKKVVPCCMIGNPDIFNFGPLGDLKEIWNSREYGKFREAHLNGRIPDFCKYCYQENIK